MKRIIIKILYTYYIRIATEQQQQQQLCQAAAELEKQQLCMLR